MMSDDRTTAFAHDGGMRNALRIANLHDTVDDVASVLIQRVVRRAVERRPGTIIVDTKTSSGDESANVKIDPNATRTIQAKTSSGDVTIEYNH